MEPAEPSALTDYLASLNHPMRSSVQKLREAILSVDPRIRENVKWHSPNFFLRDDFATFNLNRPQAVQVVLHTGAKPKPEHREITVADPRKVLRWAGRNRGVITFPSRAAADAGLEDFTDVVRQWVSQLE
ncbi:MULTISPECIES: DUF1801 domain-containing protein [Arthrobacter]|uniref:DUF1801 domain-containing protein n=1 Tax=Arthrobacter caoxuetaonis TaxID=2886935 RepID=A0A9X1MAJ6_9MICC|nr:MULTISPECIES: DUF1801 domain-containing protein [Arthrobacter]MCC3281473.1 DUF1801 domain-containing protein [Arthrobacter caoxuetaonis]MCC3296273.1 DUF1801 domain-containing protein [Arthrobacter caoxuetaonis]MCC9192349.1 DUF1801 domain-containing protein [Arthrobacter sp. zg-Y916]USQ56878.1 DUF1801 domain-containing protein [Arthrobacter caoxuetaonis]